MATVKRFNNAFGTTTDSPLGSTATTMNSDELPRLGVVDSANSEIARLTLDPERIDGAPEIIHVTDYDGSATSATIERGKEGTTAREHASGTTWEHAPTVEDVNAGDDGGNDSSVAVGNSAVASDVQSVVIGQNASADRDDTVLIGYNASAVSNTFQSVGIGSGVSLASGADNSVAIGESAQAQNSECVVVGEQANASSNAATVVGQGASAASNGVAVGRDAAANNLGVALGDSASVALNTFGVAVGEGTSCDHDEAVALGRGVATSDTNQVKVGARHLALDEISDPATPPADEGRLYFRDDGSGTTELVVLFDSGNETILATGAA